MYSQLSDWHKLHGAGLSIVLYPSDEFGGQELPAAKIPGFVSKYLPLEEGFRDVGLVFETRRRRRRQRAQGAWAVGDNN